MSDKFNGFSQDEINKLSTAKTQKSSAGALKQAFKGHNGIRRMPEKWAKQSESLNKQQKPRKPAATGETVAVANSPPNDTLEEVNLDRSMSKSIEEALFYMPKIKEGTNSLEKDSNDLSLATSHEEEADSSSILKVPMDTNASSASSMLNDSSILPEPKTIIPPTESLNVDSPFKGISLKDFESHRKMIQEQNQQKKDLLYKVIEQHTQKTAAEARKIEEIKSELTKLDSDLAVDVAILRKQIDNACVHFSNIEKNYLKIEAQFLKAKIDLHNAAEKKELLTEHLCTVIAHNEDRKAQKLSELMQKVGLSPDTDEFNGIANHEEYVDK